MKRQLPGSKPKAQPLTLAQAKLQIAKLTLERFESEIAFQAAQKELNETQDILADFQAQANKLEVHNTACYAERTLLLRALSFWWPSHLTTSAKNRKQIVLCLHSPAGQLAWFLLGDQKEAFTHLALTSNDWDGHSIKDRSARLKSLEPPQELMS